MATLEARVIALAQAVAADIKQLGLNDGSLAALNTTAKNNLVAALNEVLAYAQSIAGGGAAINDATTATTSVWSSSKTNSAIAAAVAAVVASSPATLDTLNELAAALGNDPGFATTIATSLANRVRYDAAQSLTLSQQQQACANIGVGDPDHNFVTDYNTAKA